MLENDPSIIAPRIIEALSHIDSVLILSHINPDGDAIGSMLGLYHALRAQGKTVYALASSQLPNFAPVLPGVEHVRVYDPGMALPDVDLIWIVDTATLARTGAICEEHATAIYEHPIIIVDHHETNSGEGMLNLIEAESASCADLLFRLLRVMEWPITPQIATCLFMGLVTDTQSFQTSSTNPQALHVAAELLLAGADHRAVINAVYYATPTGNAQLVGLALGELQRDGDLIWTSVTQEMLRQTGAGDDASDTVVSQLQRVAGMRICVLFKERADGTVKVSLRSKPDVNVATIAASWGGGGHAAAAGATMEMGLAEAQAVVLTYLREVLQNG